MPIFIVRIRDPISRGLRLDELCQLVRREGKNPRPDFEGIKTPHRHPARCAADVRIRDPISRGLKRPAGTTLFGDKRFNSSSERLGVVFTRGITPDGQEFSLIASLYDSRKLFGLSGVVVRRREEEVAVAAQKGALTAAGGIIGSTVDPTGCAIAQGVADAGSELLETERYYIRQPQAFIQVSSQDVLVRVDQSF